MNSQQLVDRIVRDARIPKGHSFRVDPSVLLGMADDAMETLIVPELLKVMGRYLTTHTDVALVAGKSKYRLPARAVRGEHVHRLDADKYIQPYFTPAQPANVTSLAGTSGTPRHWYFEGSSVVVVPRPAESGGYLRITYERRPSRLVLPAGAASVTSVVSLVAGGNPVRVGFTATDFFGAVGATAQLDVVKGTPGYESLVDDAEAEVETGPLLELALGLDEVEVGDWLCTPGTAPVPQVPEAFHVVLAQAVVARVHREMGRPELEHGALAQLAILMAGARDTVAPRSREHNVIVQKDW